MHRTLSVALAAIFTAGLTGEAAAQRSAPVTVQNGTDAPVVTRSAVPVQPHACTTADFFNDGDISIGPGVTDDTFVCRPSDPSGSPIGFPVITFGFVTVPAGFVLVLDDYVLTPDTTGQDAPFEVRFRSLDVGDDPLGTLNLRVRGDTTQIFSFVTPRHVLPAGGRLQVRNLSVSPAPVDVLVTGRLVREDDLPFLRD